MIWAWFLNSVAVYITAQLLKGVEIKNFWAAIFVAALLSLINIFVRPVLLFFSIPFTIVTFGLFVWIIDALLIMLVDALVKDFKVKNFGWALGFGIVMSITSWGLMSIFG